MKYLLLAILSLVIIYPSVAQQKNKKVKVNGTVIFHPAYKGGAAPPPEVLERCCKPRPWSEKVIYLKKNYYSDVLYKIKTDASGNFSKCIRQGLYRVYINNEIDKEKAIVLSAGKVDQENAKKTEPYFTFELTDEAESKIEIVINERITTEIPPP